ncbi:MAG: UbiA family prenyltransferase [Planctomycetota bacterium]
MTDRRALGAYFALTRVSLAPSALLDAWAGLAIGAAGAMPSPLAMASSALAAYCVFSGGMALNDCADVAADREQGRPRPLVRGDLSLSTATGIGLGLLACGIGVSFILSPWASLTWAIVAALAVAYDFGPRGLWLGPLLLGLCRAGNLFAAILVGRAQTDLGLDAGLLLPPLAYGAYVFAVSRLSGFEDGVRPLDGSASPGRALGLCAAILALLPVSGLALRPAASGAGLALAFALSFGAAAGIYRFLRATTEWTRARVGQAMGVCLRRLMFASACLAATAGRAEPWPYLVTVLAAVGFWVSLRLRKRFPPS